MIVNLRIYKGKGACSEDKENAEKKYEAKLSRLFVKLFGDYMPDIINEGKEKYKDVKANKNVNALR